jgi:hypothetical protein
VTASGTSPSAGCSARIGADRVAVESAATGDIVVRCARLPLALAIVAARAATNPDFPLAALAVQLADAEGRLDALDGGDPVVDVRAVFSWSYRTLSPPAARLFRLLGLHPGPDITSQRRSQSRWVAVNPKIFSAPRLRNCSNAGLSRHHVNRPSRLVTSQPSAEARNNACRHAVSSTPSRPMTS